MTDGQAAVSSRVTGPVPAPGLDWGGHQLVLLPGKAVWLPQRRWLLVADVHLGKAASFRHLGVPVPAGTTADTLARLTALVHAQAAERVVVLGDLLHSAQAQAPATQAALRAWRTSHSDVAVTLVRGNHDARAGDPHPRLDIDVVDEPWCLSALGGTADAGAALPALALCHHPGGVAGHQVLAGHDHPCLRLGGRARESLRLPCFHFRGDGVGVLPAFGSFTGMHPVRRTEGDAAYAIAEDAVRAVC